MIAASLLIAFVLSPVIVATFAVALDRYLSWLGFTTPKGKQERD